MATLHFGGGGGVGSRVDPRFGRTRRRWVVPQGNRQRIRARGPGLRHRLPGALERSSQPAAAPVQVSTAPREIHQCRQLASPTGRDYARMKALS